MELSIFPQNKATFVAPAKSSSLPTSCFLLGFLQMACTTFFSIFSLHLQYICFQFVLEFLTFISVQFSGIYTRFFFKLLFHSFFKMCFLERKSLIFAHIHIFCVFCFFCTFCGFWFWIHFHVTIPVWFFFRSCCCCFRFFF